MNSLREGARNCARFGNVQPGEEVLIVTVPGGDDAMVEAIREASEELGGRVATLATLPRAQGENLSAVHVAALMAADMVFELGPPSAHTAAGFLACFDYGTRQLALRPDRRLLASAAARFPAELFYELGRRTQALLRANRDLHLTCELGTDLRMTVTPGAIGGYIGPRPYEPGPAVPGYLGSFPPGSCVWGDVGYTATGRIVLDAAYRHPSPSQPITVTVERGWVTAIEGGPEADEIAEIVFGAANANRLAETGLGLNPMVDLEWDEHGAGDPRATIVFWTRRAGTFFIGIGGDTLQGGRDASTVSPVYGWIRRPSLRAASKQLLAGGRLSWLHPPDAELLEFAERHGGTRWLSEDRER